MTRAQPTESLQHRTPVPCSGPVQSELPGPSIDRSNIRRQNSTKLIGNRLPHHEARRPLGHECHHSSLPPPPTTTTTTTTTTVTTMKNRLLQLEFQLQP
ncbi:hypothetical protein E2C01_040109 [Portunus trituberculatus]|uniref:Uncharacterized protein n=1 Tax=Portunus trituberculatus TaxID=210409 RepID=A0A5B7FN31_PORTR|nr:hypothetical protein [Portunus trituberculatus]